MVCRECGNELRDGAKFCLMCGTPVEDSKAVPDYAIASEVERHCIFCGKGLRGDEVCDCSESVEFYQPPEEVNFCIFCGKTLHEGEVCGCEESRKVEAPSSDTPLTETFEKHFCNQCGKELMPGEVCNCTSEVATPVGSFSEVPPKDEISGGLKTTMKTPKPTMTPEEIEDNEKGKSFLRKAGDL